MGRSVSDNFGRGTIREHSYCYVLGHRYYDSHRVCWSTAHIHDKTMCEPHLCMYLCPPTEQYDMNRYGDLRPNTSGGQIVAAIIMAFSYTVVVIGLSDRVTDSVHYLICFPGLFPHNSTCSRRRRCRYRFVVMRAQALGICRCAIPLAGVLIGACPRSSHLCLHPPVSPRIWKFWRIPNHQSKQLLLISWRN